MKKRVLMGAFALASLLGGTFACETFSGQKDVEAECRRLIFNNDGVCEEAKCVKGGG